MLSDDLIRHIARLDDEATEQEALVAALAPYATPAGDTHIGEIVKRIAACDAAAAQSLLAWVRSLVHRGSSIGVGGHYFVQFGHAEVEKRLPTLKRETFPARSKLGSGTQALVSGTHSPHEPPAVADARAEAVAAYVRSFLPPSRTVAVRPHQCSLRCQEYAGDHIHIYRQVEILTLTRAEWLTVGGIRHCARSTRDAHRKYVDLAAGLPGPSEPERRTRAPEQDAAFATSWASFDAQANPTRELWRDLQSFYERFRYDSIGTLVAWLATDNPALATAIFDRVQALVDDPSTPEILADLTGGTLQFMPHRTELKMGQQENLEDLLSEMIERDGGTCVTVCSLHEPDENPELADLRSLALMALLQVRALPTVQFRLLPHVCGTSCMSPHPLRPLRRIARVSIRWQPQHVLLEDIRIAALPSTF